MTCSSDCSVRRRFDSGGVGEPVLAQPVPGHRAIAVTMVPVLIAQLIARDTRSGGGVLGGGRRAAKRDAD